MRAKASASVVAATAVQIYLIGSFTLIGLATMAIASLASALKSAKH